MAKRNPIAKALRSGLFRVKKIRPSKGKGSYNKKKVRGEKIIVDS
jgi:stalled ribosome alternative rescue factor ArfA